MIRPSSPWIIWIAFTVVLAGRISTAGARDWAVSLYGGRVTSENWENTASTSVAYEDAYLAAVAVDWTAKRFFNASLTLEVEAQAAKYFGDQDHYEFNLPLLALRWHRFPWQRHLATTLAFGLGPSYATEVPPVEVEIDGESARWMVYWFGEFTFGPPQGRWALLLRLHHRSEAFGVVADSGGSNTIAGGFKFFF